MFLFTTVTLNAKQNTKNVFFAIVCILWALVFGLRGYYVGNDTPGYAQFISGVNYTGFFSYGTIDDPEPSLELGFVGLLKLLHVFSSNPTVMFLLHGSFLFSVIFFLYKKVNPQNALWCMLLFWILNAGQVQVLSTAFRQSLSFCFLLLSICIYEYNSELINNSEKKWYKNKYFLYELSVLLFACFIHRTSILLFPIVLLAQFIHIGKRKAYYIIAISTLISIILPDSVSRLFDLLLATIGSTSNEMINLLGDRYADSFADNASGFHLFMIMRPAIAMIVIYFCDDKFVGSLYFNAMIIGTVILSLMSGSFMMNRLVVTFSLLGCSIYIPEYIKERKNAFNVFLVLTILYMYSAYGVFANWDTSVDTTLPYFFFWE